MVAADRRQKILRELALVGSVRSADLVRSLGVSEITIRRDLADLESQAALTRVHGGAVSPGEPKARSNVGSIGVVLPSARYYYEKVLRAIEQACQARRVRPVLAISDYDPRLETTALRRLVDRGVDGILLATALGDDRADQLGDVVDRTELPLVLIERAFRIPTLEREVSYVRTDHAHGARLAVRHLAALGHRRIGIASQYSPTSFWLRTGFSDEVRTSGLDTPPALPQLPDEADAVGTRRVLTEILEQVRATGATAVVVHNDTQAMRLLEVASGVGMRVPDDLAVVAYDDVNADLSEIALTAVSPPKRQVGLEATRLLLNSLDAGPGAEAVAHLELLPSLVVRSSCGGSRPPSS